MRQPLYLSIGVSVLVFALTSVAHVHHFSRRGTVASPALTDPNDDPFYASPPPDQLNPLKAGHVIRNRRVDTIIWASTAKASHQILYRTTDTQKKPEATVATVWEPFQPRHPPQMLSYHSYMDSDSVDCNPSWSWVNGSNSNTKGSNRSDGKAVITWALDNGIYVVNPDHEGPKAAFLAGYQAGQAALDGMRAARNFFGLPVDTGIAMFGYSGGASVSAWAAKLAHSYAPDVNIIGDAHGGTPIDLRNTLQHLDGGPFSSFVGAGLVGTMQAYPEMNRFVLDHVSAETANMLHRYRDRSYCLRANYQYNRFTHFMGLFDVRDPLDTPVFRDVSRKETLLLDASNNDGINVPKFPTMVWHARFDEIVPIADEVLYISQQCQHGANIQFRIIYFAEHVLAKMRGLPYAIQFLDQVFSGTTPKVDCGTTYYTIADDTKVQQQQQQDDTTTTTTTTTTPQLSQASHHFASKAKQVAGGLMGLYAANSFLKKVDKDAEPRAP